MKTNPRRRTGVRVHLRRLLAGVGGIAVVGLAACASSRTSAEMQDLGYSAAYTTGYIRATDPGYAPLSSMTTVREESPEYQRGYDDAKAGYDYRTSQRQAPPR